MSEKRRCVLIVDDDAAVRRALARALRSEFDVAQAESADEAILLLAMRGDGTCDVDVVITDLDMGKTGGDDVIRYLEKTGSPLALRAIVFTGGGSGARGLWLETFDQTRVLHKPCAPEVLRAAIAHSLEP